MEGRQKTILMTILDQFKGITTFVLDVDGVLTDGTVYVFDEGQQVRRMSIRDGFALQLAIKNGYRVLVISGGDSPAVAARLKKLGVGDVFMNVHDKRAVLLQYMKEHQLNRDEVLYLGDDIPDIAAMNEAGFPCAPADAAPEIIKIATYITKLPGGQGCAREVIEKVMKLNGLWKLDTEVPSR
jgi:3-deoxy-D-manno-octulosonate 8-phosphate phosphatase (KDO 8-P phosphatase)